MARRVNARFFYRAFRLLAWKAVYHYRRLAEADDIDDCPEGCATHKTRDGFCADCPLGESWRYFKEQVEDELKEIKSPYRFAELYRQFSALTTVTEGAEGVNPDWYLHTAQLFRIWQHERRKADKIDRDNQLAALK